jgi:dethiobiotin synthetase
MKRYFVTATHTDAGKTFVSALLTKALDAMYWKPIQSGSEIRDTLEICRLANLSEEQTFKETYLLKSPESPHSAALKDGIRINIQDIKIPQTDKNLIIEGAGGLLVPLNDTETVADLICHFGLPVILVVPTYLGCINHSLLTLESMKSRGIKLAAIIFNGNESVEAQKIILKNAGNPLSIRVPKIDVDNFSEFDEISFELRQLFF